MVIHDHYGKIYIELTEDKIILYRKFSKKKFNLKDIKAAYLTDDYLLKFIYEEKLNSYIINNIRAEDKDMLEELLIQLNSDRNVFYTSYSSGNEKFAAVIWIFISASNMIAKLIEKNWGAIFWAMLLIFWIINFLKGYGNVGGLFYYVKEEEIEYGIGPKNKNNKFSIKDEFTFDYNSIYKEYLLKKGKKKLKFPDNIIHPQYYKEKLRKLSKEKMVRINDEE